VNRLCLFDGKVARITGAESGMGAAPARRHADEGTSRSA
jgi:NADP-dependent 3-hydroxy acid dehydrogenase YdfG